jgi:hypothetical protein
MTGGCHCYIPHVFHLWCPLIMNISYGWIGFLTLVFSNVVSFFFVVHSHHDMFKVAYFSRIAGNSTSQEDLVVSEIHYWLWRTVSHFTRDCCDHVWVLCCVWCNMRRGYPWGELFVVTANALQLEFVNKENSGINGGLCIPSNQGWNVKLVVCSKLHHAAIFRVGWAISEDERWCESIKFNSRCHHTYPGAINLCELFLDCLEIAR